MHQARIELNALLIRQAMMHDVLAKENEIVLSSGDEEVIVLSSDDELMERNLRSSA